jgi:prepilin-type N-terminal cleavage/methylation domain-containing protein
MRLITKNNQGFSLLELIVVLLIISIIAAMAALSVNYIRESRVTKSTREVLANIQKAYSDATTLKSNVTFTITIVNATSYIVPVSSVTTTVLQPSTQNLSGGQLWVSMGGALQVPANNAFTISKFGLINNNGISALAVNDPALTSYTRCINILPMTVREGFWDATSNKCSVQ